MSDSERIHELESRVSSLEAQVAQLLAVLARKEQPTVPTKTEDQSAPEPQFESPQLQVPKESDSLTPEEKISLFMDYFVGRTDVFALASNSKKSWYPATVSYQDRTLLPLTEKTINMHLRRDNQVHVGLYPMLTDDTCRFLVCDFDGKDFKVAAGLYADTCRNHGLAPLVEVSRSGNGAHVWLFFSSPVQAHLARAVGIALLSEASPSALFSSFDRFFPSQDTLPSRSNSFGNLIALPLAGQHRAEDRTIFVDENFVPFKDQFKALANTSKSTEEQLKKLYINLQPDPDTHLPVPPSIAQLKALKRTGTVRITHDSRVHIDIEGVDPTTRNALRYLGALPNPQFYIKQARRFSTYGTPRIIVRFNEDEHILTLDRGALDDAVKVLKASGYSVSRRGQTPKPPTINRAFNGTLHPPQHTAVRDVLKHKTGILVAPPGTGKTVMACNIIAERTVPTAIVVPNTELVSQWRKSIETFLPDAQVGQYSGKKKKLSGEIDIITAQSISRADSKIDFLRDYGQVIVDECHRVGAAGLTHTLADLNVRYFLGLTATPYRSDGLDRLLPLICGPIRHTMHIDRPGPKQYVVHETKFEYDDPYIFWPDLDTALAADTSRNSLIASTVAGATRSGDNVLVLTKRRDHIPRLRNCLIDAESTIPVFELHGGQTSKERKAVLQDMTESKNFVLIAMSQVAGEGIDLPELDALVLAAPVAFKGSIIQQVGRVTRDASGTSSSAVIVHDFYDKNVPALAAAFRKRSSVLKKQGFTVSTT